MEAGGESAESMWGPALESTFCPRSLSRQRIPDT